MVAVLTRLKLTLLLRAMQQSAWRTTGMVIGGLLGLGALALLATSVITLGTSDWLTVVVVMTVSSIVLSWLLLPLLLFGSDETLDPARFALLPLTSGQLRPGLLLASLIGVPGILTALAMLVPALGWFQRSAAAGIAAALLAAVLVATCLLLARTLTAAFSTALSSRRFRDFTAVAFGVVVLGPALAFNYLTSLAPEDPDLFQESAHAAADILAWTPLGWAAAAPRDVAEGDWGPAAIRVALSVGLLLLLWAAWGRLLDRGLTTVTESSASAVGDGDSRLDALYGSGPAGAVAVRCLRYWRRDPRYLATVISYAVLPLLLGVSASFNSGTDALLAIPVLMAVLAGPALTSDLAYDNSALWVHVATDIPGKADRYGRALAYTTVLAPMIVITLLVTLTLSSRWDLAVLIIALCVCALLTGISIGLATGSIYPGFAPAPGENPFSTGGSSGLLTVVILFGDMALTAVLAAPVAVPLLIWGPGSWPVQVAGLAGSVVWGGLLVAASAHWSGRHLERSWPERLAMVTR